MSGWLIAVLCASSASLTGVMVGVFAGHRKRELEIENEVLRIRCGIGEES